MIPGGDDKPDNILEKTAMDTMTRMKATELAGKDNNKESPLTFNRRYFATFLFYYIVEGSNNGLFSIFVPVFLIKSGLPGVNEPFILTLATFTAIPFTIKIIWGVISDRFPIGHLGRRRPYISIFIIICGVSWLALIAVLPVVQFLSIGILILLGILINTGAAFSDTALDGLIMDVTPAEKLGRVEGATWAMYSIGGILGGTLGIFIYVAIGDGTPVFIIFGLLSIACGIVVWILKEPATVTKKLDMTAFKRLLKGKRNWNGYFFSLATHLPENAVSIMLALFLLIKIGILSSGSMGLSLLFDENLTWYVLAFQLSASGGIVLASALLGKLADKHNRKKLFGLVVILTLIFIPLTSVIVVDFISAMIAAFLVGTALGGASTLTMTFVAGITQENPASTSTHFSIFTSFMNAGSNIGLALFAVLTGELLDAGIAPTAVYAIAFVIAPLLMLSSLLFVKGLPSRASASSRGTGEK